MTEMPQFEEQLRAAADEAEASAKRAFKAFGATDAHPNSTEYQMMKSMALMAGGVFTGLTQALSLLTGEQEFERANATVVSWLQSST